MPTQLIFLPLFCFLFCYIPHAYIYQYILYHAACDMCFHNVQFFYVIMPLPFVYSCWILCYLKYKHQGSNMLKEFVNFLSTPTLFNVPSIVGLLFSLVYFSHLQERYIPNHGFYSDFFPSNWWFNFWLSKFMISLHGQGFQDILILYSDFFCYISLQNLHILGF